MVDDDSLFIREGTRVERGERGDKWSCFERETCRSRKQVERASDPS